MTGLQRGVHGEFGEFGIDKAVTKNFLPSNPRSVPTVYCLRSILFAVD